MFTREELLEINKDRKISQIGFVVKDIKEAMDNMIELFNIGPWRVSTLSNESVTEPKQKIDGKYVDIELPFKIFIALAMVGDMQFELIQPVYGENMYSKFLEEKGEGIHHFKEKISDETWDDIIKDYEEKGIGLTWGGFFGKARWAYLDTEEYSGIIYELGNGVYSNTPPKEGNIYFYPED